MTETKLASGGLEVRHHPVRLVPPWSIAAGRVRCVVRPVPSGPACYSDRIARGIASLPRPPEAIRPMTASD
jgi:hypothetical protein